MPKFAANLTMMFNEWPFLDRFAAASDAGFAAVEYLFPYEFPPEAIAERLQRHRLTQALFNLYPGNWQTGERGLAALPARFEEVKASVAQALVYAEATGVKRLHLMSGMASRHDPEAETSYRRAVVFTAERLAEKSIELMLEPINTRDMPGYFLSDFGYAEKLIADLKLPNLKLQFDIYHRQILHGDVTMALRAMRPIIGHVQVAGVPSRNEPDGEELNYPFLFGELDKLGYDGFVGCEYRPRGNTMDGLGWFRPYSRN
ncbi:MAG TPA: 2-oxo-tetronate isomerase [Hyphomicrobiales bacterium]|nr:2-oxo-tetronate isomerase [Hyphomicrobiales bacterium]